ncbi:hypothetical protein L1987_23720 [Smallanthus sonchifolius]|uniref:Uncharacterized protein n=1 Tax=Smallanthus sonchifolius TaxID=185202 RepID=A0ACB9IJ20_9ASTR|nr:hypothetical protein L1987_23720 [Smallanthus sonchifolius]
MFGLEARNSTDFHALIRFLRHSCIKFAIIIDHVIYLEYIQSFWRSVDVVIIDEFNCSSEEQDDGDDHDDDGDDVENNDGSSSKPSYKNFSISSSSSSLDEARRKGENEDKENVVDDLFYDADYEMKVSAILAEQAEREERKELSEIATLLPASSLVKRLEEKERMEKERVEEIELIWKAIENIKTTYTRKLKKAKFAETPKYYEQVKFKLHLGLHGIKIPARSIKDVKVSSIKVDFTTDRIREEFIEFLKANEFKSKQMKNMKCIASYKEYHAKMDKGTLPILEKPVLEAQGQDK